MTAATRNHNQKAERPRESFVYDGSRLMGVILPKAGAFVARSPAQHPIGATFKTERQAMRAICAADRLQRLTADMPLDAAEAPARSPATGSQVAPSSASPASLHPDSPVQRVTRRAATGAPPRRRGRAGSPATSRPFVA